MPKHFTRVWSFNKEEILSIINRALELKKKRNWEKTLSNKILGLIFEKPSTRTRVSFESAMLKLGGATIFLSVQDLQLKRGEPIKDTARVLSRYIDALVLRTFSQDTIEEFAKYSEIPIINGLSDKFHPCQVLSDYMTILEKGKDPSKDKMVWIGDGNNVASSWIELSAILNFPLTISCPEGFEPDKELLKIAKEKFSAKIEIIPNPKEAVKDAKIVYTDVWISMGQEEEKMHRKQVFKPFQVNKELLSLAHPDVIVMHCLPAHRGEEITEDVLEGSNSVVWDQAENKMWLHMALLEYLLTQ